MSTTAVLPPHPDARDRALFTAGECQALDTQAAASAAFTAYDDVTPSLIPSDAGHCSYYGNGPFQNLTAMRAACPHAILSPCLLRDPVADFKQYEYWEHGLSVDVEPSLFTPTQAAAIAKEAIRQGVMPRVYFPLSWAAQVVDALNAAGLKRSDVQLHSAHWTMVPHICSGIGTVWGTIAADQTQYTDKALGRSLDANLCASYSYGPWGQPKPPPPPPPPPVKAATGLKRMVVTYNANPPHGHNWEVRNYRLFPGNLKGGSQDHWASAEIQVNTKTGEVRIAGMPFDAKPLGR